MLAAMLLLLPLHASARNLSYGTDLKGAPIVALATPEQQVVVLVFVATDCPISNRYLPEITRLQQRYAGQPVRFWLVYPNAYETPEGVHRHDAAYGSPISQLLHVSPSLLQTAHAHVTPEAAVFIRDGNGGWKTVYHGRIDNRYAAFGKERPAATSHDLQNAITAVLHRQPVPIFFAAPVGCAIVPPSSQP